MYLHRILFAASSVFDQASSVFNQSSSVFDRASSVFDRAFSMLAADLRVFDVTFLAQYAESITVQHHKQNLALPNPEHLRHKRPQELRFCLAIPEEPPLQLLVND
jgi:hypothetical protein